MHLVSANVEVDTRIDYQVDTLRRAIIITLTDYVQWYCCRLFLDY